MAQINIQHFVLDTFNIQLPNHILRLSETKIVKWLTKVSVLGQRDKNYCCFASKHTKIYFDKRSQSYIIPLYK